MYLTLQPKLLANLLLSRTALSSYKKCQIPLQRKDRSAPRSRHQHHIQSIRILLNTQQWRRTTEINVRFQCWSPCCLSYCHRCGCCWELRPDPTCTTRTSGRGTGQQSSPPTIHTHPHPTKPAQLHHQHWLRQFIFNNYNYDRSTYPNIFQ